jgi:spermidine/putrescine transport system ATP-binding protein
VKPPLIEVQGVVKRFGGVAAVDGVDLSIREGEFFALLGPSGCGKSTLLRMIAGLEIPTEGRILIDGQDMAGVPPNRRPVNMVFQSYALFPHLSVRDNVAYGLKADGVAKAARDRRVDEALALVRLEGLDGRKPDQLSGGQKQRVALARALIKRPRVLLLDEPMSALDAKLREKMQLELKRVQAAAGVTFCLVTHDQTEALALSSRCAVMDRGKLEQVGPPADLYDRPSSRFVADFIGQVNLFGGRLVEAGDERAVVDCPELAARVVLEEGAGSATPGDAVWLAIRPQQIALEWDAAGDGPGLSGVVSHVTYLGGAFAYEVILAGGRVIRAIRPQAPGAEPFYEGQAVRLAWPLGAAALLLR